MPIYQIDIEKSYIASVSNTVYWTNVYHVSAASVAAAQTQAANLVAAERPLHMASVTITKSRVRDVTTPHSPGSVTALSLPGTRTTQTNVLPLFNVFRVDFATAVGRPSRKFLRGPVGNADAVSGVLGAGVQTTLATYAGAVMTVSGICDVGGDPFVSYAGSINIAMRQLRRGSKRRTTPVI